MNLKLITALFVAILAVVGSESLVFGENTGQGSDYAYGMLQDSSLGNMTSDVNSHGMMNSLISKIGSNSTSNTVMSNSSENKISINKVISPQISTSTSLIPSWVKTIFKLYGNDDVSDSELINALQYLITNGIIKLS